VSDQERLSVFEAVGGMPFFDELVERFYAGVADDEVLIAMYPEDLTDPKRHLALFIAQYFGGPADYHDARGAPRLRQRHFPFEIGDDAAERWVRHMRSALAEMEAPGNARKEMDDYFEYAAFALRNRD